MDYTSLLKTSVDSAERPKPLPIGSYMFRVTKFEFGESAKKKTPFVRFFVSPVNPMEDVDTELLPPNWTDREMRIDRYLTQDSMFMLKDFLVHLGIQTSGRTFDTCIQETPNAMFVGYVSHEISGDNTYANITKTAPIS